MNILLAFFICLTIAGGAASVVALRKLGQPTGEEFISTKALVTYAGITIAGVFLLGVFL